MQYPLISVIISWAFLILIVLLFIGYLKFKIDEKFGKNKNNFNNYNKKNEFFIKKEPETNAFIDGTDEVDKKIIKTISNPGSVLGEYNSMKTSTNLSADILYDTISNLLNYSNDIYDELNRNREKFNSGSSHSNIYGINVNLNNYDVKVNIVGFEIILTLNQLKNLTINDLKGKINNGLILSYNAFDYY